MVLESILAYLHILAILTMVVFLASEAALCRSDWLNAKVVARLGKIDLVYGIAAGAVLLTGIARIVWGVKGPAYYGGNWLLHAKVGLFVVIALISIKPSLTIRRWVKAQSAGAALPSDVEVRATRRLIMIQAHLLPLIPLAATFLARGFGTKA
jgi:putative membrane protein